MLGGKNKNKKYGANVQESQDNYKACNIHIMRIPKKKKKEQKKNLK